MAIYDRQIVRAQAQIKRKGVAAIWTQRNVTVNSQEPWKSSVAVDPPTFNVFIVLLTPKGIANALAHLMKGTSVPMGAPDALMGAVPFTPAINDTVTVGLLSYVIKDFDIVAPNGRPILYKLEFA